MEPIETFEHAGFMCELHYDQEPSSPGEWDQLGELFFHGRGGLNGSEEMADADGQLGEAFERSTALAVRYARTALGMYALPFRLEDYGAGRLRVVETDNDDEGATGLIVATKERAESTIGEWTEEAAVRALRNELEEWDTYAQGEVYGYVIRKDGEVVDSCWGFYADSEGDGLEEVRQEMREQAEGFAAFDAAARQQRAQGWALAHAARNREPFDKVIRPGTVPEWEKRRMHVFCRIQWDGSRLSISGVEGPRANGNAAGSCGQISMGYAHRDPADNDPRYHEPKRPEDFVFADGWNADRWLDFLDVWKRWHLNDMRAECEHQRELGWKYDTHQDPDPEAPGYPYAGLPCPVCKYRIGSAWLTERVPDETLAFLRGLPPSDKEPAWV